MYHTLTQCLSEVSGSCSRYAADSYHGCQSGQVLTAECSVEHDLIRHKVHDMQMLQFIHSAQSYIVKLLTVLDMSTVQECHAKHCTEEMQHLLLQDVEYNLKTRKNVTL